jgi:hypothetical protein
MDRHIGMAITGTVTINPIWRQLRPAVVSAVAWPKVLKLVEGAHADE